MSSNFLEIKNATFVASKKNKIDNVSLTIKEKGEIVCLLGPSGVGKTTILRTIAGLQDLKSGEINLKGKTISSENFNLEPEKRNIAMCFQDNSLFPHFNVLENINIGAKRKNGSKFNYSDKDLIKILHLENNFPAGSKVKLLLQPEDLRHDDQSKLKLEVVDRKFRGTNFIYTLKTSSDEKIPVFVHSHHIHQHEKSEKFGIKTPIFIDHLVCF